MADYQAQRGARPGLESFYKAWMTLVFLGFAGLGIYLGYTFGVGGSILGAVLGMMMGGIVMLLLNTPEKLEGAIYMTLGVAFVVGLIYMIIAFWGVRL